MHKDYICTTPENKYTYVIYESENNNNDIKLKKIESKQTNFISTIQKNIILKYYPDNKINIIIDYVNNNPVSKICANNEINTKNIANLLLIKAKVKKLVKAMIKCNKENTFTENIYQIKTLINKIEKTIYKYSKVLNKNNINTLKIKDNNICLQQIIDQLTTKT